MSARLGYVYLLSNPAMPGIVKIGYTEQAEVELRAAELSAPTSVPLPFIVECSWLVESPAEWEFRIHKWLGYCRISDNREFFRIGVAEAIVQTEFVIYETDDPSESARRQLEELVRLCAAYPNRFKGLDVVNGIRQVLEGA